MCYGCLGSVFQSIDNMVEAREYHEKALEITIEIVTEKDKEYYVINSYEMC